LRGRQKAVDEGGSAALIALIETGNLTEDADEFGAPRRQLGSKGARLRHVHAIAAVIALAEIIDRNAFGRAGVRRVHQS